MAEQLSAGIINVARIAFHPSNVGRNLGDLRQLTASVRQRGVLVPVILERHGEGYRLRDGHRRVAAARLAKVAQVPALIHADQLDERDWLLEAVEYNVRRKGYSDDEQRNIAARLIQLGVTRNAIAEAFGVPWSKLSGDPPRPPRGPSPRARAVQRLIEANLAEFNRYLAEERSEVGGGPDMPERQRRRDQVLEELDLLLGTDAPASIARRLGYSSPKNLARVLHRWGRPDLAQRFDTVSAAA